jgi:MFS family permease
MAPETTACLIETAETHPAQTAHRAAPVAHRYVFFALVFFMYTISYADRAALSIAMPTLAREFTLTPVALGWISSSFLASYFLLNLPSAILVDIYGARLAGTVAVTLWSSAMVLGGMVQNVVQFVASRLFLGAGEAPTFGIGATVVRHWARPEERGTVMTVLLTGMQLGLAAGTIGGAYLIVLFNWRVEFVVLGLVGLVWALAWFRVYRDPVVGQVAAKARRITLAEVRALLTHRSFYGIIAVQCTQNYLNFLIMSWAPVYLIHELNLDLTRTGNSTALCYLVAACGAIVVGRLAERFVMRRHAPARRRRFIVAACIWGAASIGLLPQVHTVGPVLLIMSLAVGCLIAANGANTAMLTDFVEDGSRIGAVTGITLTFSNFLGLFAPVVTGYIVSSTHRFDLAWVMSSVSLLIAGCLSILLVRDRIDMK